MKKIRLLLQKCTNFLLNRLLLGDRAKIQTLLTVKAEEKGSFQISKFKGITKYLNLDIDQKVEEMRNQWRSKSK